MDTSNSMETAERAEAVPEPGSDTLEKEGRKLPAQFEHRAERIRSSVARLTTSSINELEGLTSELNALQEYLKSEAERVQREVESALAGISIIVETIAPWKNIPTPATTTRKDPSNGSRGIARLT